MATVWQRTLNNCVQATGITAHSGQRAKLMLRPAPVDTGIVFRRVDLESPVDLPATVENVGDTRLSTSLVCGGVKIATVEHLLSAFTGLGVDNAFVDVDGPEVPIMDGSAGPFIFLIQSAGIKEQNAPKRFIRIKQPIEVRRQDAWIRVVPYHGFKIDFRVQFDHPLFTPERSYASCDFSSSAYIKDISRARTFGFLADLERLQAANLALGSSLQNTIGLDEFRVLNEDGLRYDNECARHKVLDEIGDVALLRAAVLGAFSGYKSGHTLNNQLLSKLLETRSAWEYVTFPELEEEELPIRYWRSVVATES